MADTTDENIKPSMRKPLSFSVRALMVVVLMLALGLGWLVQRAQIQRDAVRAIEKTGGTVHYEWQWPPGNGEKLKPEPKPKWLVDALGVDYFGDVTAVTLGKSATDAEMVHVGRLSKLRYFSQGQATEITDTGAAQLAGLQRLQQVGLSKTRVTSACLADFKNLKGLKSLHLIQIPVQDTDLVHIKDLTDLELIDLNFTKITDAGLAHLEGLVNLKQLRLGGTGIEGPGLAHLKGMNKLATILLHETRVRDLQALPPLPMLRYVLLDDAPVDDSGMAGIPTLPALSIIGLRRTNVTDAGLVHLVKLKNNLKIIYLEGPKITDASVPTFLKLDKLNQLNLRGARFTDAGLEQIAGLKTIRLMDLEKTLVTDAGIARLRKAHPEFRLNSEVMAAQAKNQAPAPEAAVKVEPKQAGPQP